MSVYKPKGSPFYHFDFQRRGRRFHGSTKRTDRREAQAVERAERERAKQSASTSAATSASVALDHVIGRYWAEVGQHHAGADNTWRDLARLIDYFGAAKRLDAITGDDVAKLVAWRRGHHVAATGRLIAAGTVNCTTVKLRTDCLPVRRRFGAFASIASRSGTSTCCLSPASASASFTRTKPNASTLRCATITHRCSTSSAPPASVRLSVTRCAGQR
jgi:hypothetical protein